MTLVDDYHGEFDPDFHLGRLSRRGLVSLAREYMLAAHLQDRAGIPQVLIRHGAEEMRRVAIEEWMGASPIYTPRMRRALGFAGDDVGTIFKGMQLDVGAPHQFLDFRFRVHDAASGEFQLPYCGALMDVEPLGEEMVVGMCHQIEDPTFDATAVATNPRARMRPIHRPPRQPADRLPHCHWRVTIEPGAEPVREIPLTERVRRSRLARLAIPSPEPAEPGGWRDYAGPFDPDFQLEDLSHDALVKVAEEFCVQGHLLVRAFMMAVAERWGEEDARQIASAQWVGIAGLAAERVRAALAIEGDDADAIARLLQVHPSFVPRAYADFQVGLDGDVVKCRIDDCEALREGDPFSWFALLGDAPHRALDAIVRAVNPRARCRPAAIPGARLAWTVEIDPTADPAPEPPEVKLTKYSQGARFAFVPRRPLRV
jgi:hypothetical protein